MPDRRALIIGSWLAKGRNRPSHQRIRSLIERWNHIFEADRFGYRDLVKPTSPPLPLLSPRRSEIINRLEDARDIQPETELFLYFVGHSVSAGQHDLNLILGTGEDGKDRILGLSMLLNDVRNAGIHRIICVLDTCHAGRTRETFSALRDHAFAMFATGSAYAFEANFSDALLRALEQPMKKNDQRIDRRAGGITYQKLFQEARRRLLQNSTSNAAQDPICFGDLGNLVIEHAPNVISSEYNIFASDRTIYGRVYSILRIISENEYSISELVAAARTQPAFILKNDESGQSSFLSSSRISDYTDFLRAARWVASPNGILVLTNDGRAACDRASFNRNLIEAIEQYVLPADLNLATLDTCVQGLLDDMIPPTPVRIKDRAAMLGHNLRLTPEIRAALSLLPTTGRYLKGSADAIFPAELG